MAFRISLTAGMNATEGLFILYCLSLPVLLGRLCGAFVYGSDPLEGDESSEAPRWSAAGDEAHAPAEDARGPAARVVPGSRNYVEPLDTDPPSAVIIALKTLLAGHPEILQGALFKYNRAGEVAAIYLGLYLPEETRLSDRQRLTGELRDRLEENPALAALKIIIVEGHLAAEVEQLALRIYRRAAM